MEKNNVLTIGLTASERPATIDDLRNGQGTILYNHNIVEVPVVPDDEGNVSEADDPKKATGSIFKYDSLRVEYPKTCSNIYATLLEARYPQDVQQKLFNDYQAAQMEILEDDEADAAIAAYKSFLNDRKAIKAMVKADCEANNIPDAL